MNEPNAYQIVLDPEDDRSIEVRVTQLAMEMPKTSWRVGARLWFGFAIHPLGIHTFVRHKRYDEVSDRLIDVGRVCMFCTLGLR